jgi:DNA-binding MarR family transcriptional regulator
MTHDDEAPVKKAEALEAGHLHYTERLSFPIHQLSAQLARIVNPLFREFGVDIVSSRVLVLALERGSLGAGEIVDLLLLPQSTVSHQLQRLQKIGYIERRRTGSDQRHVRIVLTERGRQVADAMVAPLSPLQLAECRATMELMLSALAQFR